LPPWAGRSLRTELSEPPKKREQAARIWEENRDVYHFVLAQALEWQHWRSEALRLYSLNEPALISPDFPINHDEDKIRNLYVDLRLYAHDKVQEAFDKYETADKKWLSAHTKWYQARNPSSQVSEQETTALNEESLRNTAKQAAENANAKQEKLEEAVRNAIHHPKKYRYKHSP
jgi:hypothetical protein